MNQIVAVVPCPKYDAPRESQTTRMELTREDGELDLQSLHV